MRVLIVTPAEAGRATGNRVTAERWQRRFEELGHDAKVVTGGSDEPADLLVALHARRSHDSISNFHRRFPGVPIVVGLAGTDIYAGDANGSGLLDSLRSARLLVALQPLAARCVPNVLRGRVRVIRQSAEPPSAPPPCAADRFDVCVLANLRAVKDPLLAARAARRLPSSSRIAIRHAGLALDGGVAAAARREESANPRYRWLGPLQRSEAMDLLASSRVLVVSSRSEGGANVVSEAIVCGVPILASRIDGNVGLLGEDHPGYFEVGDEDGLARLLSRCEEDSGFHAALREHGARLAPDFSPDAERAAWRELLRELESPA